MKIKLLALALFASTSAHAIVNGDDVSSSDYQDFVVRLNVNGELCAGSLVGGEYIVTARHCIMPISGSNEGQLYGSSVTISQGVTLSEALTYERTFTYLTSEDYDNEKTAMANDIYDNVVDPSYPLGGAAFTLNSFVNDLVVLKLNSPISHTTGALLSPIYDYDAGETKLPKDTELTFRGWGYTNEAETTLADTMQETVLEMFLDYTEATDGLLTLDSTYGYIYGSCVDMEYSGCQYYSSDYTKVYATDSGYLKPGDSGSPFVYDNQIFGVLSKTNTFYQHQSQMSDFSLVMDVLTDHFDDVIYPSDPGVHTIEGTANNYTITIPVQNFTANSVLFTPVLTDSTGFFDLNVGTCDDTIESQQGCVMTVDFNSNNLAVTDVKSASIYMTTGVNIPVTVDFESTTSSSGDSSSSGGSSGGSTGLFSFIGLLALAIRRRFTL